MDSRFRYRRTAAASAVALVLALPGARAVAPETLVYHSIQTDSAGRIVPWFSPDPAVAYDHDLRIIWNYWNGLPNCPNGVRYYLQHQVWKPEHDPRGLGGDQHNMAISSWMLLYDYLGDPAIKADMMRIADYWLDHGISSPTCKWSNLPYPYNTDLHSGRYDGDMRAGKGYLQPDKAGEFGAQLVDLYKMTGNGRYLDTAVRIADTLARTVQPGDGTTSPWPFRVNADTGEVHRVTKNGKTFVASYTSNWTGALRLFEDLQALRKGTPAAYARTHNIVTAWLKAYPLKTNQYGPFFEDIPTDAPSNTETNADTLAWYILEHPDFDPRYRSLAKGILDWSLATFGNHQFDRYHVVPINEQTAYMKPGNSHTSRHASVEIIYGEKSGDHALDADAIARMNWATYMVDTDGRNRYPDDDIWLTDGYGDYVRHYLRAMAALPRLAPRDQNHHLRTTSIVRAITYGPDSITWEKFDSRSDDLLKMGAWAPKRVQGGKMTWDAETKVLRIAATAKRVTILRN
jgi:hypothetical protein